jgi:methionyl-tRNA formyltransferase
MSSPRVYVLGTVSAGVDLIRFIRPGVDITGIIGLTPRAPGDAISGFLYMKPVADELGVEFVGVESYTLSRAEDIERLSALDIDVLIVSGWQRLVPEWLIKKCKVGVIGSHGSPKGISGGRGRSPQNWALMLGAESFSVSIFFIDPGIDSGDIIASRTFPLGAEDDITSSYAKVTAHCGEMMIEAFRSGALAKRVGTPQPEHGAYLPQRTPDDGGIDFSRTAAELSRFVAALTRPYPGATAMLGECKIHLFRARPFQPGTELTSFRDVKPGVVVMSIEQGSFIVRVGDGYLQVDDWAGPEGTNVRAGMTFSSVNYREQLKTICDRHTSKYPQFPIMEDLLALTR